MADDNGKKRSTRASKSKQVNLDEIDLFLKADGEAQEPASATQAKEKTSDPVVKDDRAQAVSAGSSPDTAGASETDHGLELILSDDGLQAVVAAIFPKTREEDVLNLLAANQVAVGISVREIGKALETVRETGKPLRDVLVAKGIAPKQPTAPVIKYCSPSDHGDMPPLEPIWELLEQQDRQQIVQAAADVQVWAVCPGDRLGFQVFDEGEPGTGVKGQSIRVPAREKWSHDTRFVPGQNVALSASGVDYVAQAYGYAGFLGGQISVLSPIWISPDRLEACHRICQCCPGLLFRPSRN
jgi:hypothetical protein